MGRGLSQSRSPPLHSLPGPRPPHPRPALRSLRGCRVWSPLGWRDVMERAQGRMQPVAQDPAGKMETGPG